MSAKFNSGLVKLQHQIWKNRLLTFLNGGELQLAVSHRDCAIGKWLYTEGGFDENSLLPAMRSFEEHHTRYHSAIKRVIDLQHVGNSVAAWDSYESVKTMSDELMGIIDALDEQIKANSVAASCSQSNHTKVA